MTATQSLQDIDVLIQKISESTGLKRTQVSQQLERANIPSFQFDDTILVAPTDLDPIIDSWAASIKQDLLGGSSSTASVSKTKTKSTAKTPANKAVVLEAAGDLSWPKGYEKVVTHLYTPTLQKVLPEDSALRQKFIDAINNNTPDGERLADELAKTIVKRSKRKLALDKVLAGLKAKVAEMATSKTASKTKVGKGKKAKSTISKSTKTTPKATASTGTLSWPDGYENDVTHLYTPTLNKVLPEDQARRQQFIDAINSETPDGERLADELAKTIIKRSKRKLSYEKVLSGLKSKVAEM